MNTLDKEYQSVLTELDDINDKNKIYLYKFQQEEYVFWLASQHQKAAQLKKELEKNY